MASVRLKLLDEHGREAEKQGAEFCNFGWVIDGHSIMSKTSLGYFDSEINPDTMMVTHQWRPYDDSADDRLANSQSSDKTEGNKIVKFIEGGMRRLSKRQC
jgi:hypothetical protein